MAMVIALMCIAATHIATDMVDTRHGIVTVPGRLSFASADSGVVLDLAGASCSFVTDPRLSWSEP